MGNFHFKTQKSTDFAHTFSKSYSFFLYFLIKIIVFYTKNLFIWPKNCVQIIFYNKKYKMFRKNPFFSNIFTFLSVIRQNFEDNLRILANFGKFSRKNSKIYGFRPYIFKKLQGFFFFFNKHYTFYTKNLFIRPKNCVQIILYNKRCKEFHKNQFFSNIFTFLNVMRQNFEDNLRILANFAKFSCKNSKIYGFRPYVFKKLQFSFFVFFNKDYIFYTKNLFIRPKNCVQIIFYNEKYKKFRKNQFFSNIFTFLSVIRQNLEDNLRILANFGKFSRKNSKIYGFRPYFFKKLQRFLFFLINIILFTLKIYLFGRKIAFKAFCTTKDVEFRKNQSFSNIFTFLSVIRQNFEDNQRILANFGKFSRKTQKSMDFAHTFSKIYRVFYLF